MLNGIIHVLQSGCRWRDCPAEYGPHTTLYNRWNRWSRRAVWHRLFEALREVSANAFHSIDSTTAKAQRSAAALGTKDRHAAGERHHPVRSFDEVTWV